MDLYPIAVQKQLHSSVTTVLRTAHSQKSLCRWVFLSNKLCVCEGWETEGRREWKDCHSSVFIPAAWQKAEFFLYILQAYWFLKHSSYFADRWVSHSHPIWVKTANYYTFTNCKRTSSFLVIFKKIIIKKIKLCFLTPSAAIDVQDCDRQRGKA